MSFNSIEYVVFLPIVWLLYQMTSDRFRWLLLLLASLGFYAFLKAYTLIGVLTGVAIWNYFCGAKIRAVAEVTVRQRFLWLGVGVDILLLSGLKLAPVLTKGEFLLVTIGVSYFIFQAISYLVDILLEKIEPEEHFGRFFLSLAFFPKLLQGPIERSGDLLPQFWEPYNFHYDNMRSGLLLFGCGLFKKIVIADRLGLYVDTIYGNVYTYTGLPLLFATYAYAFQIYLDFSGYTDMALGTAMLFNIRLTKNFNSPYLATSVADFWRRWHISFSKWILDYIFKPLQMAWRYSGVKGTACALIVTFMVSGLWHGVSWGFLVWGALHGLYLVAALFYKPYQKKMHVLFGIDKTKFLKFSQMFVTFNLVSFAWIFFRAEKLGDAWYVITNFGVAFSEIIHIDLIKKAFTTGLSLASIKALLMGILVFCFAEYVSSRVSLSNLPIYFRWSCYLLFGFLLIILSTTTQYRFVYYQF